MSRLVSFTGLVFVLVLIRCCCSCPGNNSGEVWAGRAWSDGYVGHLCPICSFVPSALFVPIGLCMLFAGLRLGVMIMLSIPMSCLPCVCCLMVDVPKMPLI